MSVAFRVPELGEGVYEAELVEWRVQPGDHVRHGQPLAEVMTDKASMELPAPFTGTIRTLRIEPGATFQVGQEILEYDPVSDTNVSSSGAAAADRSPPESVSAAGGQRESSPATAVAPPPARPRSSPPPGRPDLQAQAAPSVRRMARSLGIDLTSIAGSGPGGRITMEDVARAAKREPASGGAPTPPPLQFDLGQAGTTIPLAGLRRKVAEQMVRSAQSIPHYSYIDACDVTALVRLRDDLVGPLQAEGIKLTYLAFWVQAVVRALREVPIVNATFSEEDRTITLHDRYDIGIATATEKGLVVPVVRNADRLSLAETARTIDQLVQAVRSMRAKPDQLRGSTFTITSVGNFGGLASTPIINHPEVAIMGVGKIRRVPRYDEQGELRPVDEVYLSFSFDHRIVDGAVGALFANKVIELLRHPGRLLV